MILNNTTSQSGTVSGVELRCRISNVDRSPTTIPDETPLSGTGWHSDGRRFAGEVALPLKASYRPPVFSICLRCQLIEIRQDCWVSRRYTTRQKKAKSPSPQIGDWCPKQLRRQPQINPLSLSCPLLRCACSCSPPSSPPRWRRSISVRARVARGWALTRCVILLSTCAMSLARHSVPPTQQCANCGPEEPSCICAGHWLFGYTCGDAHWQSRLRWRIRVRLALPHHGWPPAAMAHAAVLCVAGVVPSPSAAGTQTASITTTWASLKPTTPSRR